MKKSTVTYESTGVSYEIMDPLKKMAQAAGRKTDKNIVGTGFSVYQESKGESASVIEQKDSYLAFVQEGLGTKNLVADAMYEITGKTYYDAIAQDTIGAIINDIITVGARPLTVLAYWAAGSSEWFENTQRMQDLVNGWKQACDMSGAVWAGGETPTLTNIIHPKTIDLGGSACGIISPKSRLTLGKKLQAGDAIILFESSGIHANGLSLARKLPVGILPNGYATKISDSRTYGEALLTPTIIYAKLVQDIFAAGCNIHYMANITGHGWRKIMRHTTPFTYRIKEIPPVPEILQFIVDKAPLEKEEAYGNLNMGAGYAVFVPQKDVEKILQISRKHNIKAYNSGVVEKGPKKVIIEPKNIVFAGDSLGVR